VALEVIWNEIRRGKHVADKLQVVFQFALCVLFLLHTILLILLAISLNCNCDFPLLRGFVSRCSRAPRVRLGEHSAHLLLVLVHLVAFLQLDQVLVFELVRLELWPLIDSLLDDLLQSSLREVLFVFDCGHVQLLALGRHVHNSKLNFVPLLSLFPFSIPLPVVEERLLLEWFEVRELKDLTQHKLVSCKFIPSVISTKSL